MTNLLSRENQAPQPLFLCPNCSILTAHEVSDYLLDQKSSSGDIVRFLECICLSCNNISYILENYHEIFFYKTIPGPLNINYHNNVISVMPSAPVDDVLAWQPEDRPSISVPMAYGDYEFSSAKLITFQQVVYPESLANVPNPNSDICTEAQELYLEAAKVLTYSPRAATALLRVTLETMLTKDLHLSGSIYNMIGQLYSTGIPEQLEIGLHFARIAGNAADHVEPGMIQLNGTDGQKTALALFDIINFLADDQISRKKRLLNLSDSFSQSDLDSIKRLREKHQQSQ